jgi:pimeloyl-ACP methyl ester carboxylesterase
VVAVTADRVLGDYSMPEEFLLNALTAALEAHGLGSSVGLLLAETFPRHRGGIGIIVGFPDRERAAGRKAAAWLLRQMGCDWVRPDDVGGPPWYAQARDWQVRQDVLARLRDLRQVLQDGQQVREERARDWLAELTADALRERAGALFDVAETCRKALMAGEDAGQRERIRSLETAMRATSAAIAVCEDAGAERLGDVPDWPGKLRAALG